MVQKSGGCGSSVGSSFSCWMLMQRGRGNAVVMLTIAGAVSFVHYVRAHAPQPTLVAVAPFDIFVPGLEQWRVRLAHDLTARLDSTPPLTAVSQDVVRERWRGQKQPEIAALDLARRTSAGIAVYGRLDPSASNDSVLVRMMVIDAGTGRVLSVMNAPWPRQRLPDLASPLAQHVRQNYR
ncbi:MAG: hypothetical protein AUI09_04130 [Gemmatimonadetes bacterium 13_2_20CM_2_66_5]|nr:MAG: hypothetical protein AUI09_04130 [Gemmatimonadetes bacterium 13_2_20CM_2_66_5]